MRPSEVSEHRTQRSSASFKLRKRMQGFSTTEFAIRGVVKISAIFVLTTFHFICANHAAAQSEPQINLPHAADISKTPLGSAPVARKLRAPTLEEHRVKPLRLTQRAVALPDPVVQTSVSRPFGVGSSGKATQASAAEAAGKAVLSFEGIGAYNYSIPAVPSDTTGAAGRTQYVEWVNEALAVFDKTTGQMHGPYEGSVLWKDFARQPDGSLNSCEKYNNGDPIVEYDKIHDRWLLSQFAITNGPPFFECVAVSTSGDALGKYYRYAYRFDKFNDYPKFGVWANGYYATFNMFDSGDKPTGGKSCAFNASKMLTGNPTAEMICFDTPYGGLLPADFDGPTDRLPEGGGLFVSFTSNEFLNLWKLTPDWSSKPSTATFTGPLHIAVPPFTVACGDAGSCVPQKESDQRLESLGDRLSFRLTYRRFADHDSLVAIHSVQVVGKSGQSRTGIRWYEIRNVGAFHPTVYQASTYAPDDGIFRWMGSAAMDKLGNLVIGYSAAGRDLFPSVRYAGRLADDELNTLSDENTAVEGTGSQAADRWGDYSSMTIDPEDDCTFWLTNEYLGKSGSYNWRTHIRRLRFPNCH